MESCVLLHSTVKSAGVVRKYQPMLLHAFYNGSGIENGISDPLYERRIPIRDTIQSNNRRFICNVGRL